MADEPSPKTEAAPESGAFNPPPSGGKVLLTGATGFVGRHVLPQMVRRGFQVRALVREFSDRSVIGKWTGDFHVGDVTDADSLKGACEDCVAIMHLVGVINEKGGSFEAIHVQGTRNLLEEAKGANARKFVYLSGLGAREDAAASQYHQSKYAAEQSVLRSGMDGYCFRASVIFGPEDEFLNPFVKMAGSTFDPPWPFLPAIAGGRAWLQPLWVEDAAECLVRAVAAEFPLPPGTYELGGPRPMKLKEVMRVACRAARRERLFLSLPMAAARVIAFLMETLSRKPRLTRDQLIMLREDGRTKKNKTEEILGRPARSLWDYACEEFGVARKKSVLVGSETYACRVRPQEGIVWRPDPPQEEQPKPRAGAKK